MNIRILICGVLGGLLAAYALSLPLYAVLPRNYTTSWIYDGPDALAFFGYALAIYAVLCTGYVAARWNWSPNAPAGMRTGMMAGLLAALVAYPLIGAPAAAVASQREIFLHGAVPALSARAAVFVVCECVVRAAWYPHLMFWGMVAGLTVLAGLGGWFATQRGAAPWGNTPPSLLDEGCDTSVAIMVMASWILITVIDAMSTLEARCERTVNQYGFELSYSPRGITGWPIANLFALLLVATWYSGRWCARRRNHPLAGIQRVAKLIQMLIGFLPLALVLAIMHIQREALDDPIFAFGLAGWIIVLVFWAARSSRGTADFSTTDTAPPSFRDRLLLNGGFLGFIVPGLVMASGMTEAIALALGIVRYIDPVFVPYPPLVGASAVGLATGVPDGGPLGLAAFLVQGRASETSTPVPAAIVAHATIQDIYAVHILGSLTMTAAWILAASLHAAGVQWWRAYAQRSPKWAAKKNAAAVR